MNISSIKDFISVVLSLLAFFISVYSFIHNWWKASSDFLSSVDSEELREARKTVYEYINSNNKIDEIDNYDGLNSEEIMYRQNVEKALTKVIAFYDGNAALILKGYIPKSLFDSNTLLSAVRFFDKVSPYIYMRRKNSTRSDNNKIYAQYYTELLSKKYVAKKMKKIKKRANSEFDNVFNEVCKIAHAFGEEISSL